MRTSSVQGGHNALLRFVFTWVHLIVATCALADDWPTYMHDIARTGTTSERLDPPLTHHWVHKPRHAPRPSWPERLRQSDRVGFDKAYHVAVARGAVYFGSSADDKVCCLDAATGRLRWTTFTGAPVRLAPAVWNDRVFVGCDDGRVYCLGAADGRVIWTFHAAPSDRRVLGMGRMISVWPLRTGVLVDNGIVYCTAGLFPTEGVYVYALRADTGRVVWTNDTTGQLYVRLPHAPSEGFSGLAPEGPLLASATRLYVPNGRNMPAAFDRATGRLVFWRPWEGAGGVWALLTRQLLISGGTGRLTAYDRETGQDRFACFHGRRIIATPDTSFLLDGKRLVAIDRRAYPPLYDKEQAANRTRLKTLHRLIHRRNRLAYVRKKRETTGAQPTPDENKLAQEVKALAKTYKAENEALWKTMRAVNACVRWQCPCTGTCALVLTRGVLFAGGDGEFHAVDAANGRKLWTGKVEGKVYGLAVADGRLLVSTDTGAIHCFAKGEPPSGATTQAHAPPCASPYPVDPFTPAYAAAAEHIVRETGITKGYALVLGYGTGRLAYELAKRTDLHVVGIEPDPVQVATARRALDAAGLYGVRVAVVRGPPERLPFASYFADLVVCDAMIRTGRPVGSAKDVWRVLRPLGGVACLGQPAEAATVGRRVDVAALRRWMADLPGAKLSTTDGLWTRATRGALPGAGQWTHQYGNAAGTGCSTDRLVRTPLRLLWYGRPGADRMIDRHARGAAPVSAGGRLFIQGEHRLMAVDAYNGRLIWQHAIKGARRANLGGECGNLAAVRDSVFLAVGPSCFRFDAATGRRAATYAVPPRADGQARQWGYVALCDDLLVGSTTRKGLTSDGVFALDRHSAQIRWQDRRGRVPHPAIAVGDGRVFLADRRPGAGLTTTAPTKAPRTDALLVALDVRTGKPCWTQPFAALPFADLDRAEAANGLTLLYADRRLVVAGSLGARRIMCVHADDGRTLWSNGRAYRRRPVIVGRTVYVEPVAYDLHTGKPHMRRNPLTGASVPWQITRSYGCGTISGSPNCLLFRSGCFGFYDLGQDAGISNWGGMRPGCWINAIAAAGLVLAPEASSGCGCSYPIVTTVALEPAPRNEHWSVFAMRAPLTPVRHWSVNLGAPGDRRDPDGVLWFAYPRPSTQYGVKFKLDERVLPGMGFFRRNADRVAIRGTDRPWIHASGCRGLVRCALPLIAAGQPPAAYTVRLGFADPDNGAPGVRVFDIKLQGKTVARDFDIVRAAGARNAVVVKVFSGVRVANALTIELVPKHAKPSARQAPLLNSVEVARQQAS